MNRLFLFMALSLAPLALLAQNQAGVPPASPKIVERGPHHRVWQTYTSITNAHGKIFYRTNSFVEMATGLHYWNKNQWEDTQEQIEIVAQGAVALHGPHKVGFASNINTSPAVDLATPDNQRFKSHILGLSYYDASTGKSVLIAELKDSVGVLFPPNQLLYQDAFTDFKVDVRYTYTKAGLEQDVILREHPPSPADYGLNPQTTHLEVLTEFLNSPAPGKTVQTLNQQLDQQIRGQMVEPDFVDEWLNFGMMRMATGSAFELGNQGPNRTVPVGKRWLKMNGRTFLVEGVEYPSVQSQLNNLPAAKTTARRKPMKQRIAQLNGQPKAVARSSSNVSIQVAQAQQNQKGMVLDYLLAVNGTNVTFKGDTTYYISGNVLLYGTNVIEGGAVFKYTNTVSSGLEFFGPVVFNTSTYQPAVFTSKDDISIGESLPAATGTPTNTYATLALNFQQPASVANIRVSFAETGVQFSNGSTNSSLSHAQFVNCVTAIYGDSTDLSVNNILINNAETAFDFSSSTVSVQHLTLDVCDYLHSSRTASYALTNSLLVYLTNYDATWTNQVYVTNSSAVFQVVGAGAHYLATNSPYRDIGTTNISASLLNDLKSLTTYPPVVQSNLTFTTNITFGSKVDRDTDTPDIGYHYPPLDYAFGEVSVTNATLTVTNGVTVATFGTNGVNLMLGGQLVSAGGPLSRNVLVPYTAVQEQTIYLGGQASEFLMGEDINCTSYPSATFQFTDLHSYNRPFLFDFENEALNSLKMVNCNVYDSALVLNNGDYNGLFQTSYAYLTNNLIVRGALAIIYGPDNPSIATSVRNNLFLNVGMYFSTYAGGGMVTPETLTDNIFDSCSIVDAYTIYGTTQNTAHNAYVNSPVVWGSSPATNSTFLGTYGGDIITVTNVGYQVGPLGNYYLPVDSPLIDAGSVNNAGLVGLYHYTTTTNQVKEGFTPLDIGLHYIAVDSSGQPIDSNSDGIPDYLEDANGNGLWDNNGETSWQYIYTGLVSSSPVELGHWRFNDTNWLGDLGQMPVVATHLQNVPSWSTNALQINNYAVGTGIINLDISDSTTTSEVGPAAVGFASTDFWNTLYVPETTGPITVTNLFWADSSSSSIGITVNPIVGGIRYLLSGDTMFSDYVRYSIMTVTITNLPANVYDLYVYSHGSGSTWDSYVELFNATTSYAPLISLGKLSTGTISDWTSTNWISGKQYVLFPNIQVAPGNALVAKITPKDYGYGFLNGLQILCKPFSQLTYRGVETDDYSNITATNGSVRFWFKPDWSGTNAGGAGPGNEAHFIEMGKRTTYMTNGWWSLYANPQGTQLSFGAQGSGVETNYLTGQINWSSNLWHQLVLTYTSTNSALYVDGILAT